jgi:hypothetical protein
MSPHHPDAKSQFSKKWLSCHMHKTAPYWGPFMMQSGDQAYLFVMKQFYLQE